SLAASPTMFWPLAPILTWKLVPNGAEMTVLGECCPKPANGASVSVSSSGGGGGSAETRDSTPLKASRTRPSTGEMGRQRGQLGVKWKNFIMVQIGWGSALLRLRE